MPKIKQSPKLPPEQRRKQLLGAAQRLFVKKGYRGTTTEQIARAARLTKGALYHHFKSKEDMLLALVENMLSEFSIRVGPLKEKRFTPGEFTRTLIEVHEKDNYAEFRNMMDIWVQAMRIPRIRRYLESFYEEALEMFADHVDTAYGKTRRERRAVGAFTFAFLDGLATRKALKPTSVDTQEQLKLYARLIECVKRQD
jgi:AcrR family transcriptional regulator